MRWQLVAEERRRRKTDERGSFISLKDKEKKRGRGKGGYSCVISRGGGEKPNGLPFRCSFARESYS